MSSSLSLNPKADNEASTSGISLPDQIHKSNPLGDGETQRPTSSRATAVLHESTPTTPVSPNSLIKSIFAKDQSGSVFIKTDQVEDDLTPGSKIKAPSTPDAIKKYVKSTMSKIVYTENLTNLWSDHEQVQTIIDVYKVAFKDQVMEEAYKLYLLPRETSRNSFMMLLAILFGIVNLLISPDPLDTPYSISTILVIVLSFSGLIAGYITMKLDNPIVFRIHQWYTVFLALAVAVSAIVINSQYNVSQFNNISNEAILSYNAYYWYFIVFILTVPLEINMQQSTAIILIAIICQLVVLSFQVSNFVFSECVPYVLGMIKTLALNLLLKHRLAVSSRVAYYVLGRQNETLGEVPTQPKVQKCSIPDFYIQGDHKFNSSIDDDLRSSLSINTSVILLVDTLLSAVTLAQTPASQRTYALGRLLVLLVLFTVTSSYSVTIRYFPRLCAVSNSVFCFLLLADNLVFVTSTIIQYNQVIQNYLPSYERSSMISIAFGTMNSTLMINIVSVGISGLRPLWFLANSGFTYVALLAFAGSTGIFVNLQLLSILVEIVCVYAVLRTMMKLRWRLYKQE